ncbi:hypothetical protein [Falsiroseomonas sp. HW251]|uniref:hypothetical protein n=1 Tax=Falsiroseomonas sp. HW251 TaxID=3390998 RepID=UPI003D30FEFC
MPDVYVFASKNRTNIWAGIGAGLWAVADADGNYAAERATKAAHMPVGSLGLIYCVENQSLTTPFVVFSAVDLDATVSDVWPERWVLPFRIHPLGTPRKALHKDAAMQDLPTLRSSGKTNISHVLALQPITVFSATPLGDEDWAVLISKLGE